MTESYTAEIARLSAEIVTRATARHHTIAVAESVTGGLLSSALVDTPGASATFLGGLVVYNTDLKRTMLGVNPEILALHGAVHPDVAARMAVGVRDVLAVGGEPAHIGVATTGVAGPDAQDGHPPGLVYLGYAIGSTVRTQRLDLSGSREHIRSAVVYECLSGLLHLL